MPHHPDPSQDIPPKRIADQVAEKLLAKITNGVFLPGERLPGERQLAEDMNVSRVSVRAALQRLKTRGYLRAVQGGGTEVLSSTGVELDTAMTDLVRGSLTNLRDLQELRSILESWAARRAAENASDADIENLLHIYRQAHDPRRSPKYRVEDDHRLHMAIAKASGSIIYYHLMKMLHDVLHAALDEIRFNAFSGPSFDHMVQEHHHMIVAAIAARDPDAAEAAMNRHLTAVVEHFINAGLERPA
ncbi:FadR/GntR family transcriptional regulator [Thalassospira sp.]|uniref:FadR/GntR family transcriptional regulator n=1 Tax=Thalassospira sp. TaxID=1912094 RepID=UPI002735A80A|nr:FadR/GntR family transcriptional regulator [Thalassospira sp.]MDP2700202.1 FadR/GntR family transcriptional regulator [Thalassospira sp.]